MKLQRQTRRNCRDARGERANSGAVVRRDHVVTSTTDPMKTIADSIHYCLQASNITLSVFPGDQSLNATQPFDCLRSKDGPVATVDQHSQLSCGSYSEVVLQ